MGVLAVETAMLSEIAVVALPGTWVPGCR